MSRERRGERIDIVQYDEDESAYVRHALNPASINRVVPVDYENRIMEVIVGEDQLSLAIGKRGQNVRLASKLVGWNLDIKSETEKKAEIEEEMERMARAMQELGSLPDIESALVDVLLDVGFRTIEELTLASLEDLTSIDGIDEDQALDIHDAAETRLEEMREEQAKAEAEAALAAENEPDEEDLEEIVDAEGATAVDTDGSATDDAVEAVPTVDPDTPANDDAGFDGASLGQEAATAVVVDASADAGDTDAEDEVEDERGQG